MIDQRWEQDATLTKSFANTTMCLSKFLNT